MYQKPTAAKRLYFDVIPRTVDDYLAFLDAYPRQELKEQLGNPVWHIHAGDPPAPELLRHEGRGTAISFGMLLNLAAVANSEDPQVLWGFLRRYAPDVTPQTHPQLDRLIDYAVRYFRDFVRPQKRYRARRRGGARGAGELSHVLAGLPRDVSAEDDPDDTLRYRARPFRAIRILKAKGATPERPGVSNEWFNMLYQVLLGESRGPRFGSFVALYGIAETRQLIADALAGELIRRHAEFLAERDTEKAHLATSLPSERRSNPVLRLLDCFVAKLLAMTSGRLRANVLPRDARAGARCISTLSSRRGRSAQREPQSRKTR